MSKRATDVKQTNSPPQAPTNEPSAAEPAASTERFEQIEAQLAAGSYRLELEKLAEKILRLLLRL